jgi:hypothetical protein
MEITLVSASPTGVLPLPVGERPITNDGAMLRCSRRG